MSYEEPSSASGPGDPQAAQRPEPTPVEEVDQDAPTVMRRANVPESPVRVPAGEAGRVRIHPKFDPRKAPTEVRRRPAKPVLDGTIPLATLPLRRPAAVRQLGPSDAMLGWILSITIAALVTAAVAVLLNAAKQGG
jgi:hypothetical protein